MQKNISNKLCNITYLLNFPNSTVEKFNLNYWLKQSSNKQNKDLFEK